jgi:hypothetical protein
MDRTAIVITEMWTYVDQDSWAGTDITGFKVEALDGEIGTVDEATYEVGGSYIVVKTGPWILGRKVMLPAGVISRVDQDAQSVHVNLTKDVIEQAPEFDESTYRDDGYRHDLADYYDLRRRGYRE